MLETNGIPPRLAGHECEELICQQYWLRGGLEQEVDGLFFKVNGRWHQLYFDAGIVFWRGLPQAPTAFEHQAHDPFVFRLVDVGKKFGVKEDFIADCVTEPLIDGVRVSVVFENKGTLIVKHVANKSSLRFIKAA